MSMLSLGLFGLASAFFLRSVSGRVAVQLLWGLGVLAALGVFVIAPMSFGEVLAWVATSLALWFLDTGEAKAEIVLAGVSGFLIGAVEPHLALVLADVQAVVPGLAQALVMIVALVTGLVLAAASGAAMAAVASALSLGLFSQPAIGAGVALVAIFGAAASYLRNPGMAATLILLPLLAYFGGMT